MSFCSLQWPQTKLGAQDVSDNQEEAAKASQSVLDLCTQVTNLCAFKNFLLLSKGMASCRKGIVPRATSTVIPRYIFTQHCSLLGAAYEIRLYRPRGRVPQGAITVEISDTM